MNNGTTQTELYSSISKTKQVEKVCGLSTKAANELVNQFEKADILNEVSG